MKITDVKLRFAKHYLFVQVYTDAGIVGLGEAGNWGYLQATAAAIEKFATYLIGKDPFRIEDYNQNFLRSVYFRGSVIMSAISAIDIAPYGCDTCGNETTTVVGPKGVKGYVGSGAIAAVAPKASAPETRYATAAEAQAAADKREAAYAAAVAAFQKQIDAQNAAYLAALGK